VAIATGIIVLYLVDVYLSMSGRGRGERGEEEGEVIRVATVTASRRKCMWICKSGVCTSIQKGYLRIIMNKPLGN
jgi:hypothetical protein